jgi:phage I-like protein
MDASAESHKAEAAEIVCDDGASPPEWIQLVPAGLVRSSKGDFVADREAMAATIEAFRALGRDLVIDYEHQTLTGEEAPAAGWIVALEARDDGLWARVRWTDRGAGYVARREYRYLSPVVMVRRGDKRMIAIHSVALTNDPAIVGMRPIVNKGSNREADMDGTKLREVLGLEADAKDDEMLALVKRLKDQRDGLASALALKDGQDALQVVRDLVEFKRSLLEALALKPMATAAEARGAVLALKNPSGVVSAAEFAALKERLDRREAEDLVQAALKAGKITPAHRDWALGYALKDRAGFEAFIEKAPVVVPQGSTTGSGRLPGRETGLDETEAFVCRQLGLTVDQWKKHNQKEV